VGGGGGSSNYLTLSFFFKLNTDEVLLYLGSLGLFKGMILGVEFLGSGGEITAKAF
jgi:hypothetical protein